MASTRFGNTALPGAEYPLGRTTSEERTVDGLAYVGASTLPGIGLPMCLISAELVVKRLRGDRSPGPLAEPARV